MMCSFCCGITPIIQRAGPSSLAEYRLHRDHVLLAVALEFDLDGLAAAVLGELLEPDREWIGWPFTETAGRPS